MPLNFLRRKKADESPAEDAAAAGPPKTPIALRTGVAFDGLTEEWRLVGRMNIDGRLLDALNKREAIEIHDVQWAPMDGSAPLAPAPGLKSVDPYDLIVVLAGPDSMPELSEEEKAAHRVHKVAYDVALEAPPFRVLGTVLLHPGMEPDRLLDRATEMFVAVIDATAYLGEDQVGPDDVETVLLNRFYLRGVEQIDKRTGLRHQKLPGAPLGGISWQDKS
ncbi:MAG TPA: hypothetical protein VFV72_10370 [Candidatus Limnocylindrales bacterium]|nr:hypothetical protein [Candidatus Limnocylindrales bacterium]